MRVALSHKYREGRLRVVDDLSMPLVKTKALATLIEGHGWLERGTDYGDTPEALATKRRRSILFVGGEQLDVNFQMSLGNFPTLNALPQLGANVLDIVRHDLVVVDRAGLQALEHRLLRYFREQELREEEFARVKAGNVLPEPMKRYKGMDLIGTDGPAL